ncbi:hypothetical protein [Hyphomicrobium sp. CS1GBMeth3]|uniref:hypothetical protein n=1 Tax=Hyphomicrobium sp. CS1GBMeth3 TaxID=1892845 RepID=UPI0009313FB1|nr:hypothetical protein [Hyphomicrobium sp. CS1GBMeth3]
MSKVAGWRIQIMPQYAEHDLTASVFMNVELPDLARAMAFVRRRAGSVPGERIYPVRPLSIDEFRRPSSSGL